MQEAAGDDPSVSFSVSRILRYSDRQDNCSDLGSVHILSGKKNAQILCRKGKETEMDDVFTIRFFAALVLQGHCDIPRNRGQFEKGAAAMKQYSDRALSLGTTESDTAERMLSDGGKGILQSIRKMDGDSVIGDGSYIICMPQSEAERIIAVPSTYPENYFGGLAAAFERGIRKK